MLRHFRARPATFGRVSAVAIISVLSFGATTSRAQDPLTAAATLYDQGARAQHQRDFARAARLFARADELAPEPAALEAALQAASLADDAPFAMSLVERAIERPLDRALAAIVRGVQDRFEKRAGKLTVACGGCKIEIDGEQAQASSGVWVKVGEHVVRGSAGQWSKTATVSVPHEGRAFSLREANSVPSRSRASDVEGADSAELAPSTEEQASTERGWSPAWFGAGLALTALAGGATLASGIQTLSIHEDFELSPNETLAERGRSAEARTYVLGSVTAGVGIATVLVGALAVDWSPSRVAFAPVVTPLRGGATLGLRGRF